MGRHFAGRAVHDVANEKHAHSPWTNSTPGAGTEELRTRYSRRARTETTRIDVSSAIPGPLASGKIRRAARGIEKEPQCIAQGDLWPSIRFRIFASITCRRSAPRWIAYAATWR